MKNKYKPNQGLSPRMSHMGHLKLWPKVITFYHDLHWAVGTFIYSGEIYPICKTDEIIIAKTDMIYTIC